MAEALVVMVAVCACCLILAVVARCGICRVITSALTREVVRVIAVLDLAGGDVPEIVADAVILVISSARWMEVAGCIVVWVSADACRVCSVVAYGLEPAGCRVVDIGALARVISWI